MRKPLGRAGVVNPQCLIFQAGLLRCALPLADVVETMRPLAVRPLDGAPPYLLGISVVRGVVVPVIDVAALLGGARGETVTRFVTVHSRHGTAALATGPVVGIATVALPGGGPALDRAPAGTAPSAAAAAVAVSGGEPLLLLRADVAVPADAHAVLPAGTGTA